MKKSPKIIWKFYCFVFSFIALAHLIALIHPELEHYIFYHILMAWSNFFKAHYYLAIAKSMMTILCLYPLWAFSFNKESRYIKFWQWMLILRIMLEIVGNYYEFVLIKASYHMILAYGLSVTGSVILPLVPSYLGHYFYSFPRHSTSENKS